MEGEKGFTSQMFTKKVETVSGIETKTTTITCTEKDLESAFKTLNMDPEKFHAGGTSVTRQIIYTNSAGQKEIIEEVVETFDAQEQNDKLRYNTDSKLSSHELDTNSSKKDSILTNHKVCNEETCQTESASIGNFEEDCLQAHNGYRQMHGVPNLVLSKEICSYSKEWADHLAATDTFEHRSERKYGENIFMKWSSNPNHLVAGHEAVDSWYSEIKDFKFGQEPRTLKSGHFTQVVWKESRKMGVAWARSKSGKVLVVANYDPPGNFVGKFSENVPPLVDQK